MSEITLETAADITLTHPIGFRRLVKELIAVSSSISSVETFVGFDLPHLGKLLIVSVEKCEEKYSTRFELRDAKELDEENANVETSGVQ